MKKKKRGKNIKKRKINYFSFNNGTLILLMGFILFIFNFLYELIFLSGAQTGITSYIQLIGFALIYFGLITHLILIGDKPFLKSWNYIKNSKNFIYAVIGIFFILAVIGFFLPVPEQLKLEIIKMLNELFEKIQGFTQWQITQFIFLNNLKSSFFGMVFGVFLGIFSVISILVNGYILGFVASISVQESGFSILWKLFPHGIFELPAVFISLGMGLKFGTFIFQKNKKKKFLEFLWNSLRVFVFVITPLLIIAAMIEGALIVFFG